MRIAMMTNNYKPFVGGVPISIERLSEGLRARGHEVIVFAPEYENMNEEEDERNHVVRYHSWKGKVENGVVVPDVFDPKISREFSRRKFDVIHVHHPMLAGNVAAHYSKKHKIPLVFTYHTKYEEYLHYIDTVSGFKEKRVTEKICRHGKEFIPRYMKRFLGKCSMVFAPSTDMQEYVKELCAQVPVHILPTGIPEEMFVSRSGEVKAFREKFLLCTVSRLEKEKNLYFLIDAVEKLKEKAGDCFHFILVGDGNERKHLEAYVADKGLENTISFVGAVPNEEVKKYLSVCDMFLFSSKSETQGIVIVEAMAAGLPVVAVDACGVRDIVNDRENGFLTREDLEEYIKRILDVMSNEKQRETMRENAKKTAWNYHNENISKMAEEFYHEAILTGRGKENGEYEKNSTMPSVLRIFTAS